MGKTGESIYFRHWPIPASGERLLYRYQSKFAERHFAQIDSRLLTGDSHRWQMPLVRVTCKASAFASRKSRFSFS
jgi:hypothetical protein